MILIRSENVLVEFKIPIPIDRPDKNGNIYSEECWKNIDLKGKPIIDRFGVEPVVLGVIENSDVINSYLCINGTLWHGGTECIVNKSRVENGITILDNIDITAIGITK